MRRNSTVGSSASQVNREAVPLFQRHRANVGRRYRIEGTTRADNFAMQRVFDACGYTQEARFREAWPVEDGRYLDSLGYAILRRERSRMD